MNKHGSTKDLSGCKKFKTAGIAIRSRAVFNLQAQFIVPEAPQVALSGALLQVTSPPQIGNTAYQDSSMQGMTFAQMLSSAVNSPPVGSERVGSSTDTQEENPSNSAQSSKIRESEDEKPEIVDDLPQNTLNAAAHPFPIEQFEPELIEFEVDPGLNEVRIEVNLEESAGFLPDAPSVPEYADMPQDNAEGGQALAASKAEAGAIEGRNADVLSAAGAELAGEAAQDEKAALQGLAKEAAALNTAPPAATEMAVESANVDLSMADGEGKAGKLDERGKDSRAGGGEGEPGKTSAAGAGAAGGSAREAQGGRQAGGDGRRDEGSRQKQRQMQQKLGSAGESASDRASGGGSAAASERAGGERAPVERTGGESSEPKIAAQSFADSGAVKDGGGASAGKAGLSLENFLARELHQNLNGDIVRQAQVLLRDGGEGTIRLMLKPESLGNVKIRLEMSENKVTGRIIVESPEALRAFEKELGNLEQIFRDSGYDGANLSLDMALASGQGGGAGGGGGGGLHERQLQQKILTEGFSAARYDAGIESAHYGDEVNSFYSSKQVNVFA
jgi:hypothetical protein